MMCKGLRLALALWLWVTTLSLQAFTLDWSTVSWTAGATSTTFTNVDGSGLDVRVRITGSTGSFITNFPQISSAFPADDALDIFVDYGSRSDRLNIFIEFFETGTTTWANVSDVQFEVYDLDTATATASDPPTTPIGYIDQIENVRGRTRVGGTGAWFGPTLTSANHIITNNNSPGADARADSTNGTLADNNSAGTVDVDFGANEGSQYRFFYRNPQNATWVQDNPTQEAIGIGDITFMIPEAETWVALVVVIGLMLWQGWRKCSSIRPTE